VQNNAASETTDDTSNKRTGAPLSAENVSASSDKASNSIQNSSTASLTARVLEEQEERNKRRKIQPNENLNSLFTSGKKKISQANSSDFMSRGYSIPGKQGR
jgi:hypothetical protein